MSHVTGGVVVFSLELALGTNQTALGQYRQLGQLANQLVTLMDGYGVPATWAIPDPAAHPLVPRLRAAGVRHEIALLGESSWIGPDVDRSRTLLELDRRLKEAQQAGLAVTSLVLRKTALTHDVELLARYGLTALRGAIARRKTRTQPPAEKRFGVWYTAPDAVLPARWLRLPPIGPFGHAQRLIRRCAHDAGSAHVAVDTSELLQNVRSGLRQLQRILRAIDSRRQQGQLAVETLAEVARRNARAYRSSPARSILRPAA